uniref:Uncharacterized protein n=1 Tax=Populus trichocarpa TaxID=3694 RepID=A0A2K1Y2I8_POPTR
MVDETLKIAFPFTSRAHSSFFYGPSNISAIRNSALLHLRHCSTFEVLTAFSWSCRTIALQPNPNDEMRTVCIVNARNIFNPPLARGYHGNCTASVAMAPAGEISRLGAEMDFTMSSVPARGNVASFQISYRNKKGENGILGTLCSPTPTMERFAKELDSMFKKLSNVDNNIGKYQWKHNAEVVQVVNVAYSYA